MRRLALLLCTFALPAVLSVGCKSAKGDFVEKTEEQLRAMETQNLAAHNAFVRGNYSKAAELLKKHAEERTVSRPAYQLELLSILLLDEKYDEAHQLMLKLHEDMETLFNIKAEEKAQSVWHGEVNKVYKGDSYERATFYALMALSFIRKGNYEDALRSVKNGLLADADSNSEKANGDYALLHYLGAFAAAKMNDSNEAQEYFREMKEALRNRGFVSEDADGNKLSGHCFEQLPPRDANVLLAIWAGTPPTVVCTGEYKERRSIVRGYNPYDTVRVAVADRNYSIMPGNLADLEYQATTRGGREMDNVLADKAAAKAAMNVTGNIFFVVGSGLFIAGSRTMGAPIVGLSLLGAGLGCYVVGGGFYITGYLMNPAADARYWHNLPNQIYVTPLKLSPGEHQITIVGQKQSDVTGISVFNITVPETSGTHVIHLPMMHCNHTPEEALAANNSKELDAVFEKAAGNRFLKEIK